MKKTLIYSAIAVILGLTLTLVPLTVVTETRVNKEYAIDESFMKGLEQRTRALEGAPSGLGAPKYSIVDFEILLISFIIALAAYVLLKWRIPH